MPTNAQINAAVQELVAEGWEGTYDGGTLDRDDLANIARAVLRAAPPAPEGDEAAKAPVIVESLRIYYHLLVSEIDDEQGDSDFELGTYKAYADVRERLREALGEES